ncbi:hypothetical protein RZ729_005046 [Escherichia coli]|nr:hypothetical protein [Escherichia coli]
MADWLINGKLSQEVVDRINADAELKQYIDQMIALVTGDPEFTGIEAEFVLDGIENQKIINDKTIQKIKSLQDLISYNPRNNEQVVELLSYHVNSNIGGDLFMWRSDLSKAAHDGGYIIDPTISLPSLATFNTYYPAVNSTNGVWVRLNNNPEIYAENYGLSSDSGMVWNCAAIQKAISMAIKIGGYVSIGGGTFKTTNPILLCNLSSTSDYSIVPKIVGSGKDLTILKKISTNSISALFPISVFKAAVDVDAVIFSSPLAGKSYLMNGGIDGLTLSRFDAGVTNSSIERGGYGYYAHSHIYRTIKNLVIKGGNVGYYTFDCWMSQLNQINTERVISWGFYIDGGTSQTGKNLYVVGSEGGGVKINGLQYSNLEFSADRCGGGSANMEWLNAQDTNFTKCYEVTACRGVVAFLNAEVFGGKIPFYFSNSKGIRVSCVTWAFREAKVNGDPLIVQNNSIVKFETCDFADTYRSTFTKYHSLFSKSKTDSLDIDNVQLSPNFTDYTLGTTNSTTYLTKLTKASYIEINGNINSIFMNSTAFTKVAYIKDATRIFIKDMVSSRATFDRFYTFDPVGIAISAISISSSSPTNLSVKHYRDGVEYPSSIMQGYIQNGWLYLKSSDGGNSIEYSANIVKNIN